MATAKKADGNYLIEFSREELAVLISALGWADRLNPSDAAFQEYVGWPRPKFQEWVRELADSVRADSAESQ